MAKVSELKERARALEQQGRVSEALAIYRHILNHLERTPAIEHELPLYVKVGDLSLKLGNPTWAISMYERAAGHYVRTGASKTIISLCDKIVRVDGGRVGVFRELAERLVAGGQLQAAVAVLQEYARRVRQPEAFVRLQGVVDRPDDEARRGIQDALAELDGKPAAPAVPPGAAASPPPTPAGIGLITEPQFGTGATEGKRPANPEPVAPVDVPVVRPAAPRFAPPPPPAPPPPREPPPVQLEPGPFAPPTERQPARASGPHRFAEPERPVATAEPSPPDRRPAAEVATKVAPAIGGRVIVPAGRAHTGRLLWIGGGVAAVVVVTVGLVLTLGKRSETATGGRGPVPSQPTAAAGESASAPAGTGPVAQAVPTDTGRAGVGPALDTARAALPPVTRPAPQPPAPTPTPVRVPAGVPAPPAPVTVQLPEGARVTGVFIAIGGLPIDSVSEIVMDGRAGYRVVQRLSTGEALVLTAVPVLPGSDSIGLGTPQVMRMFGDVVGARRYWSYQVNVRGSVSEDTLSRLLGRLVRARGGS